MDNQIAKTCQSLTTAPDMRDTTKMLMQPYANWEEYLTPAPLSIAIMGELVFISSGTDFSINKNPPPNGFQYIKYPDSFRACLMQICNSGWHAFNEAHNSMNQIRIHTGTVPNYMKEAVKILFNAPDNVIETLLPNQLDNIRDIAEDCMKLADSVEKKYRDVIKLIQELLEACINAEHFYGEELEKVKMQLMDAKLREESAKKMNEMSKEALKTISQHMEDAQSAYKQAMDSMPSGWEMVGMDCVEAITGTFTALVNGLTCRFSAPFGGGNLAFQPPKSYNTDEHVDEFTQMKACAKSAEILSFAASLKEVVKGHEIDLEKLYDAKNKRTNTSLGENGFRRISQELRKTPQDKMSREAAELCESGIRVCEELAKYDPNRKWDEKTTERLIKDITELNEKALAFDCKSKSKLGSPALGPKPPMMSKAENNSSGHGSASQRASQNARFKIEQSREQLNHTRKLYDQRMEDIQKSEKELNDILTEMQNCKVKEINFDTTIKMLVKGLDAMGRVKEQWEKMVRFFQMISVIIKTSLSKTLKNFVKGCDDSRQLCYNDKLFAKDLLYKQAFEASNIASLVHMIAGTYAEVSNKYLMDRVSSLGRLMALDKERPEFEQERMKLQDSCREAQDGILQLVLKNKEEFERKTKVRMEKIEGELKAILPAAPPQETKRIKEIVQAGFGEEEANYY